MFRKSSIQLPGTLIVIILLAVVLRVTAAFYLGNQVTDVPGAFDQISYDTLAQRVLAGYGFSFGQSWWPATPAGEPTAHWSYLYTLFLTAVYGLAGHNPLVARLIQAVLAGVFMPWLTYRLGRRYFGERVGLGSAMITAVYAYFIYYGATLMTETFYITGILWTLDLAGTLAREQETSSSLWKNGLLLGIALGFTVLMRQVFLLFVPILFVWLLWQRFRETGSIPEGRSGFRDRIMAKPVLRLTGALVLAIFILVLAIAPWTWRNYRAFDRFVLLNTNAGFAFFWGNHPIHGSNFIPILPEDGPSYQSLIPEELRGLNEAALEQALMERGLGFIKDDFGRYLLLSLSRITDYFQFWPSSDSDLVSNLARVVSFGVMLPFMAFGFFYNFRRSLRSDLIILYLFIIFYTIIHLLSWALIRYRLPVDAVLIIFAGGTFNLIAEWLGSHDRFGLAWFGRPRAMAAPRHER